jgi:Raf kinase inhibitor-like YbhB/YbcL family protein
VVEGIDLRLAKSPRMRRQPLIAIVAALGILLSGCGGGGEKLEGPVPAGPEQVRLSSPAFKDNGAIPAKYTCDGEGISPPLQWSKVPSSGITSLALLVVDPDAPGGPFLHWSVWNIPANFRASPEGNPPPDATEGENSFGDKGYGAPCPPKGSPPHRYQFVLYGLTDKLPVGSGASPNEVRTAIAQNEALTGLLVGTYGR